MLKGALHTHTTKSDGKLSPLEVLRAHREQAYDFIALTDHDFLKMPNAYEDVPDVFEGMLVYKGVEKTVFARGYLHVNLIPGREEALYIFNHPAEYDLTVEQCLERLTLIEQQLPIDAIEVSQKGYYTPEYDIDTLPHVKVVSDDSHTREMIGRAWVEVEAERDHDAVLRAIKSGRFVNRYAWTAHSANWKR